MSIIPRAQFDRSFTPSPAALRPREFWTTLHPVQRSVPWQLMFYALIIFALAAVPFTLARFVLPAPPVGRFYIPNTLRSDFMQTFLRTFPQSLLQPFFYGPVSKTLPYLLAGLTLLPFLNYLLLLIFQGTMRRVRVRHHHILRCAVYSSDILIWSSCLLCLLMLSNAAVHGALDELLAWTILLLVPIIWITITYRLMISYRRYLRFHHAEAAVLSVQVIVFLLALFGVLFVRLW